ncbi:glycosyltransferase family 4 protein [Leifsonia sp. NPDC058292]|uniref:glycosyltransferase family 4 protein n=1 Tax=Leifsonia sp. NPDC058292 TaxID=3346428 RepID=UPI0036DC4AAB
MRVLMVSQYYKPEGAHVVTELAESLAERGHDVTVLTAFPNYPEGRLFPGYRQSWRHVEHDGDVTVRRVPIVISHSANPIGRILNYLSFALSSLTATGLARRADVVYVYATQMTAAAAPSIWSRFGGPAYVLHVQDLWPESITASGMVPRGLVARVIERALARWLRWTYRNAAATIAIAPTMAAKLSARGVPSGREHVVLNWGRDVRAGRPASRRPRGSGGTTVMYAGTLGDLQDLETAIRAAKAVSDLDGFRLSIVGGGLAEERLKALARELECDNVEFVGRIPADEMLDVYERSDFQLVPLKDVEIFRGTIPSKFQASLSLGLPVITTVAGDLTEIVDANGVGFTALPENPDALAEAFRAAHAATGDERAALADRARAYYESTMTRETTTRRIESILERCASKESRR